MKITKEELQQITKEEIEAVLNEELVEIHGSQINGRDVYYVKYKNDKGEVDPRDAGQRPDLPFERQISHCNARASNERVHFNINTRRCEYDYPDDLRNLQKESKKMKITKEQLQQIIKEEVQATLKEAEGMYGVMGQMPGQQSSGARDLSKDYVLYNAVKYTYDRDLARRGKPESDEKQFVNYLESLKAKDTNDDQLDRKIKDRKIKDVNTEIKDLIWGWLNNEDYFIKLGKVPSIALALAGMKERAINLMEKQEVDEGLTKSQADKARKEADKARRDREARERGEKEDTSVDLGFDLGAMMRQNRPKKKRNR